MALTPEQEKKAAELRAIYIDTMLTSGLPSLATMGQRREAESDAAEAATSAASAQAATAQTESAKVPDIINNLYKNSDAINAAIATKAIADRNQRSAQEKQELLAAQEAQDAVEIYREATGAKSDATLKTAEQQYQDYQAKAVAAEQEFVNSTGIWGFITSAFKSDWYKGQASQAEETLVSLRQNRVASTEVLAREIVAADNIAKQVMTGELARATTAGVAATSQLQSLLAGQQNLTQTVQAVGAALNLGNEGVRALTQKWKILQEQNVTDANAYAQVMALTQAETQDKLVSLQMKKLAEDPAGTRLIADAMKSVEAKYGIKIDITPQEWAKLSPQERANLPWGQEFSAILRAAVSTNAPISQYKGMEFAGQEGQLTSSDKVNYLLGVKAIDTYNQRLKEQQLEGLTGDAFTRKQEELNDPNSAASKALAAQLINVNNEADFPRADKIARDALASINDDATPMIESKILGFQGIETALQSPTMKAELYKLVPPDVKELLESGGYTAYQFKADSAADLERNEDATVDAVVREFTKALEGTTGLTGIDYKAADNRLKQIALIQAANSTVTLKAAQLQFPLLRSINLKLRSTDGTSQVVNMEDSGVIYTRLQKKLLSIQAKKASTSYGNFGMQGL